MNFTANLLEKYQGIHHDQFSLNWRCMMVESLKTTLSGENLLTIIAFACTIFVAFITAFLIFEDKIDGYPNYKNKGIKIFP